MKIALGCDHAGFPLKEKVKGFLTEKGYQWEDFGTFDDTSVDYPDYAFYVGKAVVSGQCEKGILICGTGVGMSIAANKIPGIRCALCNEVYSAKMTSQHNDSNVLAMGARVIKEDAAFEIVEKWLTTEFKGGRHGARLEKIRNIEDMMAVERAEHLSKLMKNK